MNNTKALEDLCVKEPELRNFGFYRKLNDGNLEFTSFCSEAAQHMIAVNDKQLENILNELLPKGK